MKLHLHRFDLPLKYTFTLSRSSIDVQPTLIVELEEAGMRGYGEATQNLHYGVTISSIAEPLKRLRATIEACQWDDPAEFWQQLAPDLSAYPFAQCALDEAAHDLWGKLQGQPVFRLWDLQAEPRPETSFTIGIDTIEVMVEKLLEMPNWPIYKIKLGTPQDLEIIRSLRRHTDAVFRVDANCGWGVRETVENSRALADLDVEFIEQPLPRDQWDQMLQVKQSAALPVIADESCISEDDVARCAGCFDGINIKLVKCGGPTPARRMITQARRLGLSTMVGCMVESTVGISSIAQLLPLLDYADLDGPLLLAQDIATGVSIKRGCVRYAELPGCGVVLTGDISPSDSECGV